MLTRNVERSALRWAVALTLALIAARASAADLVVWSFYHGNEKPVFEKLVARFNEKQGTAGSHVSVVSVPWDAFADKVTAAVPRGRGPDLFVFPQDRLGGWVEAGNTVEPIDFYLDAATKKRFIPQTLQALTYRGIVYGLPLNFRVLALIYNKKLVAKPPKTTAELEAVAKKLTNRTAGTYGLAYDYLNYYYHAALQNGFGGRVFDANLEPAIDSPENAKALELMLKWKAELLPSEPSGALVASLFNEGKAAMIIEGSWFLGEISKSIDYGLAQLPTINEANGEPMRPWLTAEGLFITPGCKDKKAAYDFISSMTDLEAAKILALEAHALPANAEVYRDPAVASDVRVTAFFPQVRVSVPMPNAPEMTMMWSHMTPAMGAIARKAVTPAAALSAVQAALVKDVEKLRKKP